MISDRPEQRLSAARQGRCFLLARQKNLDWDVSLGAEPFYMDPPV